MFLIFRLPAARCTTVASGAGWRASSGSFPLPLFIRYEVVGVKYTEFRTKLQETGLSAELKIRNEEFPHSIGSCVLMVVFFVLTEAIQAANKNPAINVASDISTMTGVTPDISQRSSTATGEATTSPRMAE